MKHDAFQYQFTPRELKYFLFSKKTCPRCGGRMDQSKGYETRTGAELNSHTNDFFVPNANVKKYMYFYTCQECGTRYSLKELAGGKEG